MTDRPELESPFYGVWIPGLGWLRGANNQAFADSNKDVARELARRIRNRARVHYIDSALVDLEGKLLEAESKTISFRIMRFIKKR